MPSTPIQARDGPDMGRRLVSNMAANVFGQVLLLVLALASTPYIIRHFGPDLYGALILLLTYMDFFALAGVGVVPGLVKYVAESVSRRRTEDVNAYVGTALTLLCCGAGLVAVGVAAAAPWIVERFLGLPEAMRPSVVAGFWIAGGTFLFRFVSQVFSAVVAAAQRFDCVNAVTVATESIRILGSVAVIASGHLFEAVLWVSFVAVLLGGLANFFLARRLVSGLSWRPRYSPPHLRSLAHFTKFVLAANVSSRIVHSADNLIVGYFLPVAFVAYYAVPYGLSQQLWSLVGNVTSVVFPAASVLSGEGREGHLRELYLRGSKIVAAAAAFPAMALCLLAPDLLRYWVGQDFAEQGATTLRILAMGFLANCLAHIPYVVAQACGKPQIPATFAGLNAAMNLALFLLLVPLLGIVGAAIGFLASQLVLTPCFVFAANRLVRLEGADVLGMGKAYGRILLMSFVACAVVYGARPWVGSLATVLAAMGGGACVYLALVAVFVLDDKERSACVVLFGQRLGRKPVAEGSRHV